MADVAAIGDIDMKPVSFLSFDVEALPGRARVDHVNRLIWGKVDGAEFGIRIIASILGQHKIKGNFLVDLVASVLRGLTINRANKVLALDTTYIPMAKGFVYQTAAMDWANCKALASTVAITLEACHAVAESHEAFTRHGQPEIVNTDQGSQFTEQAFVHAVKDRGYHLSMDGRGAWRDNVFVERL